MNRDEGEAVADTSVGISRIIKAFWCDDERVSFRAGGSKPAVYLRRAEPSSQRQQLAQQQRMRRYSSIIRSNFYRFDCGQIASLVRPTRAGSVTSGSASQTASPFQMITGFGLDGLGAGGLIVAD